MHRFLPFSAFWPASAVCAIIEPNRIGCVPFSSSKAEVVEVLGQPESLVESRSSGRPVAIGTTSTGRTILVVYEEIDEDTAYPATAYDLED